MKRLAWCLLLFSAGVIASGCGGNTKKGKKPSAKPKVGKSSKQGGGGKKNGDKKSGKKSEAKKSDNKKSTTGKSGGGANKSDEKKKDTKAGKTSGKDKKDSASSLTITAPKTNSTKKAKTKDKK